MYGFIKKYWFFAGLLFTFAITLIDTTETVAGIGRCLKAHHGPGAVIFLIFFSSGLILRIGHIKSGLMDVKGIIIALAIIFLVAPAVAGSFSMFFLDTGIKIGLFLVAVMPTTLSSGVVMTGAAGGNMAHALVITIIANGIAVCTIPVVLSILLNLSGEAAVISINKPAIMIKLGLLVLFPLCVGFLVKLFVKSHIDPFEEKLQILNQCLILGIVWMALSQTRDAIINSGSKVGIVIFLSVAFHGILLAAAGILVKFFRLEKGKRESVIFMGGQKTLPLSVILQVSLFPQYGVALVVCVLHHVIQLLMDGYLVGKLATKAVYRVQGAVVRGQDEI